MELHTIEPERKLKEILSNGGVTETIYCDFDRPTSNLPKEFVEIQQNGSLRRLGRGDTMFSATLAVTINVKLLPNDIKNHKKETAILKRIETALAGQDNYRITQFAMFKGKSINSGYSYKTINIHTNIT